VTESLQPDTKRVSAAKIEARNVLIDILSKMEGSVVRQVPVVRI
jgi:hypothetical protein